MGEVRRVLVELRDDDERVRVWHRQRPEEQRVGDAEHRRRCPDSDRHSAAVAVKTGRRVRPRSPISRSVRRSSSHGRPRWSRSASIAWVAPPNRTRARRAASADVWPLARSSSSACSRWKRSSRSRSWSVGFRRSAPQTRCSHSRSMVIADGSGSTPVPGRARRRSIPSDPTPASRRRAVCGRPP